jgi:addiction module HigA family antidote
MTAIRRGEIDNVDKGQALKRRRRPTLPGEILIAHYLEPRGVPIAKFADAVGCSRKHMSNIVHGHARIEARMATRIAKVLGTTPQFWMNLQAALDLHDAAAAHESWQPPRTYEAARAGR